MNNEGLTPILLGIFFLSKYVMPEMSGIEHIGNRE
jgi:hypothetical protein